MGTPGRLALVLLTLVASAAAAQPQPNEHEVKAAYLYNFARFVNWPPRPAAGAPGPFAICVIGADPFGRALDAVLDGVSLDGASVVARRVASARDALACRVLFISASEERGLERILGTLDHADVLTVSDIPRFAQRGGMIQFVIDRGRVRFEVALPPAEDAGLTLRSDLLRVASAVRRARQPGG